jgi:MFS family permease
MAQQADITYTPKRVQRIYLTLLLFNTLAASFIWGVNTIFLLNAGLSNFEAFAANAFFSLGEVLFEVPTGIIADTLGRRVSYLLGAATLMVSTLFYLYLWYIHGAFWLWALSSMLLGLGFTFFSGAVEAWLVDALHFTNFKGSLESVFAKGQTVSGIAMLTGSVAGGVTAQMTSISMPYILRSIILLLTFVLAFIFMKDIGFTPTKSKQPLKDIKQIFKSSITFGLRNPPVRWIMLAAIFTSGVSFYVFYALQPHLLKLYGNEKAYTIAGMVAALVAGAQIAGGLSAPYIRKLFKRRTTLFIFNTAATAGILLLVGLTQNFWVAIGLIFLWGLLFAATLPVRQAYINEFIPSEQRATVLSFDSLMGSSGGIAIQPILGKTADMWGYATSFMVAGAFQTIALPFLLLARKEKITTDRLKALN